MIDILLPVYNGEVFLSELLESLRCQTFQHSRIIIANDCSEDNSLAILESFLKSVRSNALLLPQQEKSGIINTIASLLEKSEASYVMFCDQDDVWFYNKVEKTLEEMQKAEKKFGKEMPLLIHSDLCVVDEKLKIIGNSYFRFQNLNPRNNTLNRLLLQNVPSGCTMMINRALAELASPIPEDAVMHDHWFSLVAAAFGKIIYLDEPTLYYRQHADNFYGASLYGWRYFYKRYHNGLDTVKRRLYQNIRQAEVFLDRYQNMLPDETIEMLRDLSDIENKNWLQRRSILMRHKIYKYGWRRNIGTLLII